MNREYLEKLKREHGSLEYVRKAPEEIVTLWGCRKMMELEKHSAGLSCKVICGPRCEYYEKCQFKDKFISERNFEENMDTSAKHEEEDLCSHCPYPCSDDCAFEFDDCDCCDDECECDDYEDCYKCCDVCSMFDECRGCEKGYVSKEDNEKFPLPTIEILDAIMQSIGEISLNWTADAMEEMFSISNVKFENPRVIVFWNDGTVTRAKCMEGDKYDPYTGFAVCVAKKALGNKWHALDDAFYAFYKEETQKNAKVAKEKSKRRKK